MTTGFNVGATGSVNTGSSATVTIPSTGGASGSGVLTGDTMLLGIAWFTEDSTQPSFTVSSAGPETWTQIGTVPVSSASGIFSYATVYKATAQAATPGKVITISETGSASGTTWITAALGAWTGFAGAGNVNQNSKAGQSGTTIVTPSTTTVDVGDWAVSFYLGGTGSGATVSASSGTQRVTLCSSAGISAAIWDSAGSVGGAGTAIGGATLTSSGGGSNCWPCSFTVDLLSGTVATQPENPVPPQIPHPLWFELLEVAYSRADWQAQGVASLQQQHWRLFDAANGRPGVGSTGTQPPSAATFTSGSMVPGLSFYTTSPGMWFEGYWWWVTSSGGQPTGPQKFALWSDAPNSAGGSQVVAGSVVTSGTLSPGWNWVPLPVPVQLSLYSVYAAATGVNGPFPASAAQWSSGDPYAAGVANGPLAAFSDNGAGNPVPGGYTGNGCAATTGPDPSQVMPAGVAGGDIYWLDVQLTNTAPPGYPGSRRLWPNTADADAATSADAAFSYVIGTEVTLSQQCVVNALWYYVPSGMGSSGNQWATSADIWNARTGVRVATQPAPVWIRQGGGVDGQSNSGRWVYTQFPGTVTLPAGDYYFTIYNGNVSPNGWGAKRLGYWKPYNQAPDGTFARAAPGAAGITNGPLCAPSTPDASPSYEYNGSAPGSSPPFTTGVIEPGQSIFAQGPPNQLPYLYVTGLFQNYWIDPEVTPASLYQPDAPDLPQRIPHPLLTQLLEVAAYRATAEQPPAPPRAAAASLSGTGTIAEIAALGYAAALSGTGTAGETVTLGYAATLAGAGSLAVPGVTLGYAAALAGVAALAVPGLVLGYAAVLSGQGSLAIPGAVLGYSAGLAGQGSLTAPGVILGYAAGLSGAGSLGASAAIGGQFAGAAVLACQGSMGPGVTLGYAAALAGTASLAGTWILGPSAALSGTGLLSGTWILGAAAQLAGQGSLSGSAAGQQAGAAVLAGLGVLTASGRLVTPVPFTGAWHASPLPPRWYAVPLPARWQATPLGW